MIRELLHKLIRRRHFWRDAGFDELTELYISNMLRAFASSVLLVFIPFYLHELGFSLAAIFSFYGAFFGTRVITDVLVSYFVAQFGPKHSMIISCMLQIIGAAMLLSLGQFGWPLILLGVIMGTSGSFFFIAYHVEFSKVKHAGHVGKEVGNMQIFQKAAAIAGPLLGGLAGTFLGPEFIFIIASLVLIASLYPLFQTAEPIALHQPVSYRVLPFRKLKRDYLSNAGLCVQYTITTNMWPLYIALFALSGSVYAKLGSLASLSVLASIAAAHIIGRYVDTQKGRPLLRVAGLVNAVMHAVRPLVNSLWSAFAMNIATEAVTTSYQLPYTKGFYARADEVEGARIAYITSMEAIGSLSKSLVWWVLVAIASFGFADKTVLVIGFMIAALASLFIALERFPALARK